MARFQRQICRNRRTVDMSGSRIEEAEKLLREATDLLASAFCHEGSNDLQQEINEGRWNGVRTILERSGEFLSS